MRIIFLLESTTTPSRDFHKNDFFGLFFGLKIISTQSLTYFIV